MHRDRDFDAGQDLPPQTAALTQDLELDTLFAAMAAGDKFLLEVAKKAVLTSLNEAEAILYRQHVLAGCLGRPAVVREMYAIAVEAFDCEKKVWGWMDPRYPDGTRYRCIEAFETFAGPFRRLGGSLMRMAATFAPKASRALRHVCQGA